jgi:glycine dehydrogenase subunit 1
VAELLQILATQKIVGGIDLSNDYPELGNALLVCATELRSDDEIEQFATALEQILC